MFELCKVSEITDDVPLECDGPEGQLLIVVRPKGGLLRLYRRMSASRRALSGRRSQRRCFDLLSAFLVMVFGRRRTVGRSGRAVKKISHTG